MPYMDAVGYYIANHSDIRNRTPLCRCQTVLVSDGFDIHCPNPDCPLTILARLQRLGITVFNDGTEETFDHETGLVRMMSVRIDGFSDVTRPFAPILQGLFWGHPGGSLEHILMHTLKHVPLNSYFLVKPLFLEFTESVLPRTGYAQQHFDGFLQFYADMEELVSRRDVGSHRQNMLMQGFLRSLALEKLTPYLISKMMEYEARLADSRESMLAYAYLLTNSHELVQELDLYPLEAHAVVREVYSRRFELSDIFFYYSQQNEDVPNLFNSIT
jgi:hypothetical protein